MWVVAKRSFFGYANGVSMVIAENQIFDLPDGTDWIEAGFVVPLMPGAPATPEASEADPNGESTTPTVDSVVVPEVATIEPSESAVLPVAKAKKAAV